MKTYREKVGRFIRPGGLEYEDGNSDNNEGVEEKCGATMMLSTAKNVTRLYKKKSTTTTTAKKNKKKKKPCEESCGVVELV